MENIKMDYEVISGIIESLAASGLPMDDGSLDFGKDCHNLAVGLGLVSEVFDNYVVKKGKVTLHGVELSNEELFASIMYSDWQLIDGKLYTNDGETPLEDVMDSTAKFPKADINRVFTILNRCRKLGGSRMGEGHNCFLKGITVSMNITAPQYWWLQFDRYHFADVVSSQSTMHRLTQGKEFNQFVSKQSIDTASQLIDMYCNNAPVQDYEVFGLAPITKADKFQIAVSNIPEGLQITRRITTNYLQLVSIYNQRKNHKLDEWQQFCEWIETLPLFTLLTTQERI